MGTDSDKMKLVWLLLFLSGLSLQMVNGITFYRPPQYNVSLDIPPETRWARVANDFREFIPKLRDVVIGSMIPKRLVPLVEKIGADVDRYLPYPYAQEIKGIAKLLNMSVGDLVVGNLLYDISAHCTSIVAQDSDGQIWHARNMDYAFTNLIKNLTAEIHFQKAGKTIYSSTMFVGYVGILSGQRPNGFTLTVDERDLGSPIVENLLVAVLDKKAKFLGFDIRTVFEEVDNFTAAVDRLSHTDTMAPVYLIMGGAKPSEGAVITRSRLKAVDVWRLDPGSGRWFLVETNYDHWTTPPPDDNRRDPAIKAVKQMGQKGVGVQPLLNVLKRPDVSQKSTAYSMVMSASQPQIYQTWVWPQN